MTDIEAITARLRGPVFKVTHIEADSMYTISCVCRDFTFMTERFRYSVYGYSETVMQMAIARAEYFARRYNGTVVTPDA